MSTISSTMNATSKYILHVVMKKEVDSNLEKVLGRYSWFSSVKSFMKFMGGGGYRLKICLQIFKASFKKVSSNLHQKKCLANGVLGEG